jgi:small subunit ribosomal protein S4
MGDPHKLKNKYEKPKKLWDEARIGEEKGLKSQYSLKNMRELWVATQELKKYRREARRLLSLTEEERKDDAVKILAKLNKMGILKPDSPLDTVLSLNVKEFLDRRLQTIVLKKGLAKSMRQSRQLITHGFISVNGRRISAPSYFVSAAEESTVSYARPIDLSVKEPAPKEAPKEGTITPTNATA